jgi:hypothetical protein
MLKTHYDYIIKESKTIRPGNIVYVKNGIYKGDIGKIVRLYQNWIGEITYRIDSILSNDNYSLKTNDIEILIKNNINFDKHILKFLNILKYLDIKDADYISITDKNDSISYLPINKISKEQNPWDNKNRVNTKIGRFIKKYLDLNSKSIENLVNDYKSNYDLDFNADKLFNIVSGDEIAYWYDYRNYEPGKGTLNNSCMRSKKPKKFLIYTQNPDVCKMIIMKNDKNKLEGRSLLWETNKGTYMDRPYCRKDSDIELFYKFAKKKGWKNYDTNFRYKMKVFVKNLPKKKGDLYKYPYMDTFRYLKIKKHELKSHGYEDGNWDIELDGY